jgi:hypothetical protein
MVVVVINDGVVKADNQSPPPHAPNGRLDDAATDVVGCPPIVRSPTQPLPILCIVEDTAARGPPPLACGACHLRKYIRLSW